MPSKYLDKKFQERAKEYNQLVQCNRCGFCETVCPTYMASGKETLSPRGRNQAFRQILEGKILNPQMAEEIFSTCLTCHACTNVCFSEVPVANLMASAKNILAQKKKLAGVRFVLLGILLSKRKILSLLLWILFLFKNIGVSSLLQRLGILKKISPELDAAEKLLRSVPLKFGSKSSLEFRELSLEIKNQRLRTSNSKLSTLNFPLKNVVYFSGCGMHYLYPQAAKSCLQVLKTVASAVHCPNTSCCGLVAHSMGDIPTAKKLAEKNIQELGNTSRTIVVDDDSCCGFMKSYGDLLERDLPAVAFSNKVKNLAEFLQDAVQSPRSKVQGQNSDGLLDFNFGLRTSDFGRRLVVTYHDPCQMGNAHKAWNAPRAILKIFPGVDFVEMEEAHWCCGGAGSYCLKHPVLADEILERKLENIQKCEAEIVLTQAASCLMHIGYGLRKKGLRYIQVMHLAEFLFLQKAVGSRKFSV